MKKIVLLLPLLILFFAGCKKEAGEGGNSSITGKVWVLNYNSEFTHINSRYYGPDEEVYIIYGDDDVYSDSFKTSYDGTYRFKYLRKGKYKLFCYSKDTTQTVPGGLIAVVKEVEITSNNQEVVVDDLIIVK